MKLQPRWAVYAAVAAAEPDDTVERIDTFVTKRGAESYARFEQRIRDRAVWHNKLVGLHDEIKHAGWCGNWSDMECTKQPKYKVFVMRIPKKKGKR